MLTDRAPFDYRYLSRRLLTDLVQHDEAARSGWTRSLDINLHMFGLHLRRQAPDLANLHDLAMRSSGLVLQNTGSIDEPGAYMHGQMDLYHGVFAPHMGWCGGEVACYRGESTSSDGDVFVALFGSTSNVVGRRGDDEHPCSIYPSDIAGLYALLDAVREADDPPIDPDFRWEDQRLTDGDRAERAVMFARDGATGAAGSLEFLARTFIKVDNYSFGGDVYHRVVVGAPLWIATPRRNLSR